MNKNKIRALISVLTIWRNVVAFPMYFCNRKKIDEDMERCLKTTPFKKCGILALNYLLWHNKPFRSAFAYRTYQNKPFLRLFSWLLPPKLSSIEIYGKIEGGLLLFHNMGCVVHPASAGKNLTVAQGVTIGAGKANAEGQSNPILGDNVWICTNAVVFGGIRIGNNVTIGAGTVLNRSVPDNCTVVGNPARIVKRDGVPCDEKL